MSNNTFSGLEMLKIAILMEEEGYNFYVNGANNTTGKIKDFLLAAAGQEFIHKEKFTKLFNELSINKEAEAEYLFDEEVTNYLRALVEKQVFNKTDQSKDAFIDLRAALTTAIKTEALTVKVYTQMYEAVSENYAKEIMAIILDEEKEHVAYFSKLLQEIVE